MAGAQAQATLAVTLIAKPEAAATRPGTAAPLDPAHLSDVVRVQASADSSIGIARVTFEIDDQFRSEAKAPPYLYDWDTLEEDDGAHTVAVTAYDTNGQTTVKRLKVTVDNQLGLGIKVLAARALEAFHKGDAVQLEQLARRAYKISTTDPEAARVMALSIGIKGDLNRAFQILDDPQVKIPPQDPITQEIRSYLLLTRAANAPNLSAMVTDLQAGLPFVRQRVNAAFEAALAAYPADSPDFAVQIARGDVLFAHRDFYTALESYQRAAKSASGATERRRAQHRIGLAMLNIGRVEDALRMLTELARSPDGNATSSALLGAVQFRMWHYHEARKSAEAGVQTHNVAALMVAALSDLVNLAFDAALNEARESVHQADTAETQYVAQAVLADGGDREGARKSFQIAFLRAPLFLPILIERGFDIIAYDKADDRYEQALGLFDLVLRLDPDNTAAQAGRIATLTYTKRRKTAGTALTRLIHLDHFAPDSYVLQAVYLAEDNTQEHAANAALVQARALAPDVIKYPVLPQLTDFVPFLAQMRRVVPLTPQLLDRADNISVPAARPAKAQPAATH
jgi:tetratricopeptide (TPR) repeat protein